MSPRLIVYFWTRRKISQNVLRSAPLQIRQRGPTVGIRMNSYLYISCHGENIFRMSLAISKVIFFSTWKFLLFQLISKHLQNMKNDRIAALLIKLLIENFLRTLGFLNFCSSFSEIAINMYCISREFRSM